VCRLESTDGDPRRRLSGGVEEASSEGDGDVRPLCASSPDAVVVLDASGRVLSANRSADDLFAAIGGAAGREVADLVRGCAAGAAAFEQACGDVLGGAEHGRARVEHPTGGGTRTVDWLMSRSRVAGDDRVLLAGRDITEPCAAVERRLTDDSHRAHRQRVESLDLLAGGVAHDVNNLLLGVIGHADLALRTLPRGTPARDHVAKVIAAARTTSDACQKLLACAGRGSTTREPTDMQRLVEEMAHLLHVSLAAAAVLKLDFAPGLPLVAVDRGQIRQVVLGLVVNASEALGDSGGDIQLSVDVVASETATPLVCTPGASLPPGTWLRTRVTNGGATIDRASLPLVFDPYYSTKGQGRGLGLALVRGIVRGHGGHVDARSDEHEGTVVSFYLPAAIAPAATDERRGAARMVAATGAVLVVDDEPNARRIAQLFLEDVGYEVLLASDGREAVEMFRARAGSVVAVVLDLTMPNMSGEETFRQLREIRGDVPVVLSSGYAETDVARRFAGQPAVAYIQKPYRFAALVQRLRETF
jgi:signal transduction histidine kinase/CheY-like chemotaxis protein